MKKEDILRLWSALKPMPIKARAIPYKHEGSTFDQDGIRITGSPEFVASVLSNLKDMLKYENNMTRLQVVYQDAKDKNGILMGTKSCYIQVHERGREAQIANTIFGGVTTTKFR